MSSLEYESNWLSRDVGYRLQGARCRKERNCRSEERDFIVGNKNCKMQDITVFCNYSCSVATDTLGLYCSVNRQDMKLDRLSVFC